jgi:molybdenum cofactor biosynthesis enzyme MoaA
VRLLPARRDAPAAGRHGDGALPKIVDECARLASRTCASTTTASHFDRQLVEKVRYAKAKGIAEVGMISNGSLITEDLARGMIEAGLDAINISVDAAGKDVFEKTRLHLNYDTVIGNVRTLARLRDDMGRKRPKLILSFVRQNNSAEETQFIAEWSRIADKIHITELHNWAGTLNSKSDVRYPYYRRG